MLFLESVLFYAHPFVCCQPMCFFQKYIRQWTNGNGKQYSTILHNAPIAPPGTPGNVQL